MKEPYWRNAEMRKELAVPLFVLWTGCVVIDEDKPSTDADPDTDTDTEPVEPGDLTATVVTDGLENPFEIVLGPEEGTLWVTERTAGRVTHVDLTTGQKTVLLTLEDVLVTEGTQDGLLGMLLDGDTVFLSYSYDAEPGPDVLRRIKLVRYHYDPVDGGLTAPMVVLEGLPGSNDHNGGRFALGPDDKLYYSIGDQGHNQLSNYCLTNEAQTLPTQAQVALEDWGAYQGKILRMERNGSIPEDNPTLDGVQSHIWSYGHRNPQGLAFSAEGKLYQTEHGPKSDDELNLVEPGNNYGWPYVAGYQDDQAYVYADWSASTEPPCEQLTYSDFEIPPSVPQQQESDLSHPDFQPPLKTFYTVSDDFDFQDPACEENGLYFICWPTIAPSSLSWFGERPEGIEGLENSLIITSLKLGTLFQVPLDQDGLPKATDAIVLFESTDRFRDTAFAPDGQTIYLATDTQGYAMGGDGAPTDTLTHPGAILALTPAPAEE
jgi:PQQ-dependent dehydrogenase (s-GDH family)